MGLFPELRLGHAGAPHPHCASPEHTEGDQGTLWGQRRQGGAKGALRGCLLPFQVPTAGEDDAACLPEQEWGGLDSRQQELYRMAVKGSYEAVVSLGKDQSLCTSQTLCRLPSTTPCPLGRAQSPPAARGTAPAVSCFPVSVPQDVAVRALPWRSWLQAALTSSTNYFWLRIMSYYKG